MATQITEQDVRRAAQAVATARPGRRNPLDPSNLYCVYTHQSDPDWHCFAGAVLLELACDLPMEFKTVSMTPDRDRFESNALSLLRAMQGYADERKRDEHWDIIPDEPPVHTFAQVWEHFADEDVTT